MNQRWFMHCISEYTCIFCVTLYYDAPITSQISVHLSRGGILRFHKGHALKEKRVKGWNLPRQQFLSSLWLQLSEQACVVPFMDMWEETRDDGRQPLTAISPGNFHTERKSFIKHTWQFQHRLLVSQLIFYIYIFSILHLFWLTIFADTIKMFWLENTVYLCFPCTKLHFSEEFFSLPSLYWFIQNLNFGLTQFLINTSNGCHLFISRDKRKSWRSLLCFTFVTHVAVKPRQKSLSREQ